VPTPPLTVFLLHPESPFSDFPGRALSPPVPITLLWVLDPSLSLLGASLSPDLTLTVSPPPSQPPSPPPLAVLSLPTRQSRARPSFSVSRTPLLPPFTRRAPPVSWIHTATNTIFFQTPPKPSAFHCLYCWSFFPPFPPSAKIFIPFRPSVFPWPFPFTSRFLTLSCPHGWQDCQWSFSFLLHSPLGRSPAPPPAISMALYWRPIRGYLGRFSPFFFLLSPDLILLFIPRTDVDLYFSVALLRVMQLFVLFFSAESFFSSRRPRCPQAPPLAAPGLPPLFSLHSPTP